MTLALVEVVADEAHAALGVELLAVVGDDAAGFLSAMLEGVQAERGDGGGVGVPEDAEDPAFLAESVVVVARWSRIAAVARQLRAEESWSPPAGGLPLPDERYLSVNARTCTSVTSAARPARDTNMMFCRRFKR